ncbi:MAG: TetR/AcrR family transcriptional regulator [Dehalococcoidales bacterium]|nr:TetR/AcrR family transcriptional regulator [Dehalococcoidales bacterium]
MSFTAVKPTEKPFSLNGNDRRLQIALKALELFAVNGYDKTTVEDIVAACGMSKGNFYYYFDNKEELVYLLRDWSVRNFDQEIKNLENILRDRGPLETMKYYIKVYIENVDQSLDAYNFLNHVIVSVGPEGKRKLLQGGLDVYALFERILDAGIAAGIFEVDNPKLFAHNITRLGTTWAHSQRVLPPGLTLTDFIYQQTQFCLKAIIK